MTMFGNPREERGLFHLSRQSEARARWLDDLRLHRSDGPNGAGRTRRRSLNSRNSFGRQTRGAALGAKAGTSSRAVAGAGLGTYGQKPGRLRFPHGHV